MWRIHDSPDRKQGQQVMHNKRLMPAPHVPEPRRSNCQSAYSKPCMLLRVVMGAIACVETLTVQAAVAAALQVHGQADFSQHVAAVVAGSAVHAHADIHLQCTARHLGYPATPPPSMPAL